MTALSLFESNRLPLDRKERWRLTEKDAVAWLRTMGRETVDLFITDPAYESLEKHRAVGTTTRLQSWFQIFRNERFPELLEEMYRVLKPDTHFYVLCDHETARVITPMAEAVGFTFWKPLIWDKMKIGMGYHYRARYEFVLFFEKGKRKLNDLGTPDVLPFERVRNGYPTEKPEGLLSVLVSQSSEPGEIVGDPFSGSASAGAASLKLGRRFVGCDISPAAIELGRARLKEIK